MLQNSVIFCSFRSKLMQAVLVVFYCCFQMILKSEITKYFLRNHVIYKKIRLMIVLCNWVSLNRHACIRVAFILQNGITFGNKVYEVSIFWCLLIMSFFKLVCWLKSQSSKKTLKKCSWFSDVCRLWFWLKCTGISVNYENVMLLINICREFICYRIKVCRFVLLNHFSENNNQLGIYYFKILAVQNMFVVFLTFVIKHISN